MDNEPVPIDIKTIDLKRLKDLSADLPGLMEYAHSVGGFSIVPTSQGVIKGKALTAMKQQSQMQLDMLYEQIKLVAKQIKTIKDRAAVSELIYDVELNFEPVIGSTYYIYLKDNKNFLSMISPQEWENSSHSFEFLAEVELLADHTWKVIKKGMEVL